MIKNTSFNRIHHPMTYLIAAAFVCILASLGLALVFMLRRPSTPDSKSNNMARALAFRVGFSILLFICVLLAWQLGLIHPTGIPAGK